MVVCLSVDFAEKPPFFCPDIKLCKSVGTFYALIYDMRRFHDQGIYPRWSFSVSIFDHVGFSAESICYDAMRFEALILISCLVLCAGCTSSRETSPSWKSGSVAQRCAAINAEFTNGTPMSICIGQAR